MWGEEWKHLCIVVHFLDPQSKGQGFKYVESDDAMKRVMRPICMICISFPT